METHYPLPITHYLMAAFLVAAMSGCGSISTRESPAPAARAPDIGATQSKPARSGGYYLNDGPGDNPPPNLEQIPDAVPRPEPLRRANMRPYSVMGQDYTPMTELAPYKARGIASWYGRRYHGQKTSSGEIYDMYGMTAAHTVLPIPSYARITNLQNNKSIVVRINDRGPFHSDRLIDLSYTAAYKLGVLGGGRAMVEVETILPDAGTPTSPVMAAPNVPVPPAAATPTVTATTPVVTGVPIAAPPPAAPVAIPLPAEPAATARAEPAPAAIAKAEPAATAPVVAVTTEQKGVFLQLGAFGSQENADSYLARLRSQVLGLAPALHIYRKDGLFRVHAGPYASQADARTAADRISQALGIKAMVLMR